ncbi:MAG: methionyl-tRNA formyltransferase [Verrucomicrobiae bacterium]|nr:methionyl-tRNA formyltransferase [Verrucomicrobiae bacterium]
MSAPAARVVFLGTPEIARTLLRALASTPDIQVVAVGAQPDRPLGRGLQLTAPPVKQEALRLGIPVLQPESAREPAFLEALRELRPDLIVVAAYGQILPQKLLDLPPHGCVNVHTSLLPRWRGAAPIQWAIASGDTETGVTLMRMDAGLDTGPMITAARTPITDEDTAATLHDRLAALGAQLLADTLPAYLAGRLTPRAQPAEGVTIARKIHRNDGHLDWTQSAETLWRRLRAFTPWPGAFALVPSASHTFLLKVHAALPEAPPPETAAVPGTVLPGDGSSIRVACGRGVLRLLQVQPAGGRRMDAAAFLAGHPVPRLE